MSAQCLQHSLPAQWACRTCRVPLCPHCGPIALGAAIYCPPCLRRQERRRTNAVVWSQRIRTAAQRLGIVAGLLVSVAGTASWITGCEARALRQLDQRYRSARPLAPDFSALDLHDHPVSLQAFRGKVVLLDFWATWCGPCLGSIPDMKQLAKTLGPEGLALIGISQDHDRSALLKVVEQRQIDWPQVWDDPKAAEPLAPQYGVRALPTTVVLDKHGRIFSDGRLSTRALKRVIRFLLDQPS